MKLFDIDSWNEIWETIRRNRRRSIITAFGVFWGIFMLIVMMGFGNGLERQMRSNLGDMATNSCFYFGGHTSLPYKGLSSGRWWSFRNGDIVTIKKELPEIKYATGFMWGGTRNFSRDNFKGDYQVMGYAPEFNKLNPQKFRAGRYINDIDMEKRRKVCVIGQTVSDVLFPGVADPTGKTVKMNNIYLTVVGVIVGEGGGVSFSNPSETVTIPFSTLQQMYNKGDQFDGIAISAYDDVNITEFEIKLKDLIRNIHTISPDDTKAINGFNMGEQFEKFSKLFLGINILTWIVGLGTLIAGIVGISNIMLIVVRERTQEIGVRRALGAPPIAIIAQIMSESFVLTFIAGILGLTCAVGLLSLAETIMNANIQPGRTPFNPQISLGVGVISLVIIILGGLLAGLLPAMRAIKVKPVDAIREE